MMFESTKSSPSCGTCLGLTALFETAESNKDAVTEMLACYHYLHFVVNTCFLQVFIDLVE